MRLNIKDIISATNCTEEEANQVESIINKDGLLDWSECTNSQLSKAAKASYKKLKGQLLMD